MLLLRPRIDGFFDTSYARLGTSKHALLPLKVGSHDLLVRTLELLLHLPAELTGVLLAELSSRLFTLDVLVGRLLTAPLSTGSVAFG